MLSSMKRTSDPDVLLLQAAADPTRLSILRQLSSEGPVCACDFTACCAVIWYSLRVEAVQRFRRLAGEIEPVASRPAAALRGSSRRLTVIETV
jgi:hypothetical protein